MTVAKMKQRRGGLLLLLLFLSWSVPTVLGNEKRSSLLPNTDGYFVPDCRDEVPQCADWAGAGYCEALPLEIKPACRASCPNVCDDGSFDMGEPQRVSTPEGRLEVVQTLEYLRNEIYADDRYEPVRERCVNRHESCAQWASQGECEKEDAEWMLLNCAPACRLCFDLDVGLRCFWDPQSPQAFRGEEGGLHAMFERITTDPEFLEKYNVTVLSRPSDKEEEDGPWVVTLDNFVSEEECQTMIDAGATLGYERSEGQAPENSETGAYVSQVSEHRTSYQAWCQDDCYEHPIVQQVTERMAHVTGIAEPHYEYMQLLKYEVGQYYKVHHDYIDLHQFRPMGPRILTFFLYLNEPTQGGGTYFPELDITVMPKRGRALIWPSVRNENPMEIDPRTDHEALPVIEGQKYGANAWLHLGNFKQAFDNDCVW